MLCIPSVCCCPEKRVGCATNTSGSFWFVFESTPAACSSLDFPPHDPRCLETLKDLTVSNHSPLYASSAPIFGVTSLAGLFFWWEADWIRSDRGEGERWEGLQCGEVAIWDLLFWEQGLVISIFGCGRLAIFNIYWRIFLATHRADRGSKCSVFPFSDLPPWGTGTYFFSSSKI